MSVFIGYPSFMAYQMMKGKKDNNEGFPTIPGTIARYSALGLTNEEMSKNPVWVDKTGNGHDLQMKNFAWGGMSGVGGYNQNFNQWGYGNLPPALQTYTPHKMELNIPSTLRTGNVYSNLGKEGDIYDFTLKIVGLKDGASLRITKGVVSGNIERIEKDGIYKIYQPLETSWDQLRIYIVISNPNLVDLNITIEQLPLYPGALVFDGVDDYGVCDNFPILTKEKGYTVVALRSYLAESIGYLVYNGTNAKQSAFAFERSDSLDTWSWGKNSSIRNSLPKLMSYQTSNSYNNNPISTGEVVESNNIINVAYGGGYCNVAIWELVFLDHDATEEELTKIKDYFVKTYPWLFPDQAWTVTGKTNENEDRATIANITGNGNDLVLSNFGFIEGSGYGLYAENYAGGRWVQSTDRADLTWTSYSVNITSVKVASTQLYYQSYPEQPSFIVPSYKIKVYGLKDGQTLSYRQATSEGQQLYKISEDGTYTLPSFPFKANGDWYGFTLNKVQESCDITIEQIPEYEGYLITDGVDDKAVSKQFKFGENFTVILDFKFPVKKISYCGFDLSSKVRIQNLQGSGVYVVLKGNKTLIPSNVVRAVTSEGKVYDENWNEYNIVPGNISSNYTMVNLGFDGSNQFAESATKLAGIYSSTLSKDDCIKAYNYLQTLKAK